MKPGLALLIASLLVPMPALAQSSRVEATASVLWDGPSSAGQVPVTLTPPPGATVTVVTMNHRSTGAIGAAFDLSHRLGPQWRVGLAASWSRPSMSTRLTGDIEGVPETEVAAPVHRFTVTAVVQRTVVRQGRWESVVAVGAGWLREVTQDSALAGSGVTAHAGGGLKYWMRDDQPGWLGRVALRVDVRVAVRRDGVPFGTPGTRWAPQAVAGLVIAR